ncbi:hypothetical protein K7X08_025182 [Anisodus acutangulus]|uniref:Uncharacterized protein n=1 Tax=Anisodus acutangulus TaxID=402998 RepID=A0A9Q1MCB1_9SOLA|nr:hypothetical protein K7X08_025182 [Anisodus acutangulus]
MGSSVETFLMQHKDYPDAGKLMLTAVMLGNVHSDIISIVEEEGPTPMERKDESSSTASVAKESSSEKSKAESVEFYLELDLGRFEIDQIQLAIRPSLSEWEKGANVALEIWFGTTTEESSGPHP